MALSHSSQIVTDGLVFYYDMSNPQKSFRGAPTTNLIVTTPYTLTIYTACSGPVPAQSTNEFGQTTTVNRYTITGTGGTPRGRITATGLTAGVTYSYSIKIRYNGAAGPQSWHLDSSKGSPEGGTNNNTFNSRTLTSTDIGNGWYKVVETFNFATCPTGKSMSNFGFSAPNASYLNQTFDVYDLQFEQSSFATPFVAGTRSNTESIIDLTNNNTVTANSLTYAADGSFGFNGTTDFASFGNGALINSIGGTSSITVEAWVRYNSYVGSGGSRTYSVVTHKGSPWTWLMENPSNRGRIRFTIGGADVNCSDPDVHPLNTWMNWVGTYDGANMRFFRNGILKNTVARTGTLGSNSINAQIGQFSNDYRMDGNIGILKIHNQALSAQEVQQNFNALRGRYGI